MKTPLKYLVLLLLLSACLENQEVETLPPPLYALPQTVELNIEEGYTVNAVTGDTIQPILRRNGDTLATGVPILVKGEIIHPDSVERPLVKTVGQLNTVINAHPNVKPIPIPPTISINKEDLTTAYIPKIASNDTVHYRVSNIGDTILCGRPIPARGKVVPVTYPNSNKSLPPKFKDAVKTNLKYLDVDQGLVSYYVRFMLEDRKGNIWLATLDKGVSVYDGVTFTNYGKKEGLVSNEIFSMLEDRDGNIWFGAIGGVSKYDGTTFTNFSYKNGLSRLVYSLLEDRNGNIWMGTNRGVSIYDGANFTHLTTKEGLNNKYVTSMLEDREGNIWMSTLNGVNIYDGKSFTYITKKEGLSNSDVRCLLEDREGNIWMGTYGGVNVYDGRTITQFTEKEGLSDNAVRALHEDKHGNIWLGTNRGVSIYNGTSFTYMSEKNGLCDRRVRSFLEDESGNMWIGTYNGGVGIYNGESFVHFTRDEGLPRNTVDAIIEDEDSNIWLGMYDGGAALYNGQSFTHFGEKEGVSQNIICSLLEDENGSIWLGTFGHGVNLYDGVTITNFTRKQGLVGDRVITIIKDKNGNMWFGTGRGLSIYNGEFFTNFTRGEGLPENGVTDIIEDKKGNIWIGTGGGGVSVYDGTSFVHFTEKNGLSDNDVTVLFEAENGNIWIGTQEGGLNVFDKKSFTYITKKEGLSDNGIMGIVEDREGHVWVSTDNGLNKLTMLSKEGLNAPQKVTYDIKKLGKNDGLLTMDFQERSILIDRKNQLWLGTPKSLNMLDLTKQMTDIEPPKIHLKQVNVNEQFIDYRNISDSLSKSIVFDSVQRFENIPLNLELPYDKNHLTFHFAGIDWNAPYEIRYSYLLEGFNTHWSQPGQENKVDYRNLSHGTYTFKVRAIGESDQWSEAYEYTFTIHPPWNLTWWAKTLYGFMGLLLIYGFIKWRTTKLKQRQKELEIEVDIATNEVRKQKEQIEEAYYEITDSINYAERIQRSYLATKEMLDNHLDDYFVFFQPKHVVSGDFYWAGELRNGHFAIVNGDSTGHGVPGAIMSIINISSIEKAVEKGFTHPAAIFNDARQSIVERLKKDGSVEGGRDGMDASMICFDKAHNSFLYTAAQNPIWVVRSGEMIVIDPEKMPLGKSDSDEIPFEGGEFELEKGDQVYLLTDGFQDQFGGPKGKKFMVGRIRNLILSISTFSMKEQHQKMQKALIEWQGEEDQVDDICVMGIKI